MGLRLVDIQGSACAALTLSANNRSKTQSKYNWRQTAVSLIIYKQLHPCCNAKTFSILSRYALTQGVDMLQSS